MLESYHVQDCTTGKQMWRLSNPPGLPFHDDIKEFDFVRPAHCRAGVLDEVSKIISLLSDEW